MKNITEPAKLNNPEDDLNSFQVKDFLFRRKKIIGLTVCIAFLSSIGVALTKKPVWQAQFQIVVANNSNNSLPLSLAGQSGSIVDLIGILEVSRGMHTEVKIMQSPSVLKPVFDYVKSQKSANGIDVSKFRFLDWKKNSLNIEFERKTTVVDVSYIDTDKELVLPVIQKISKEYQEYSRRDRERGLERVISYLDAQIDIFKQKSINNLGLLQKYSIEQDLIPLIGDSPVDQEFFLGSNIEESRIEASNDLKNAMNQLETLKTIGDNSESLMYLGSTIPQLREQELPQELEMMDIELSRLRTVFNEKDRSIQALLKRRSILINTLRRQAEGYLNAQVIDAELRLEKSKLPAGVLLKYKQLQKEAIRSEDTFNLLSNQRLAIALEKAQDKPPWELISQPTLLDYPVAPNKRRIVFVGTFLGIVFGFLGSLCFEIFNNKIYNFKSFERFLPYKFLGLLESSDVKRWDDLIDLMVEGSSLEKSSSNIGLLKVGNPSSELIDQFTDKLKRKLNTCDLIESGDLFDLKKCSKVILLLIPGFVSLNELEGLNELLNLQKKDFIGWIFLEINK